MDSILSLISLTPKISVLLVQYFLEGLKQKRLLQYHNVIVEEKGTSNL